jgi:hypothetical protein
MKYLEHYFNLIGCIHSNVGQKRMTHPSCGLSYWKSLVAVDFHMILPFEDALQLYKGYYHCLDWILVKLLYISNNLKKNLHSLCFTL